MPSTPDRPRRPLSALVLAAVYLLLALIWLGMAIQNFTWNEYKPGKPMDPDLVPWSIGLLAASALFGTTALGLLRMRRAGRRAALALALLFVALAIYGILDSSPLLPILIIPGLLTALCAAHLALPATGARFR
jgi:hypothetical protein